MTVRFSALCLILILARISEVATRIERDITKEMQEYMAGWYQCAMFSKFLPEQKIGPKCFADYYTEDVVYMIPELPTKIGIEEVATVFRDIYQYINPKPDSYIAEAYESLDGKTAYGICILALQQDPVNFFRIMMVWKKVDNRWKIHRELGGGIARAIDGDTWLKK